MGSCNAKAELYYKIAAMKRRLGIDESSHLVNLLDVCACIPNISLGFYPFSTPGLRGIAALAEIKDQNNVIILNKAHSAREQNFSCGHEMVHISEHGNAQIKTFNCFDHVRKKQNRFLEWQANEGSAELLVSHNLLLPIIREYHIGPDDGAVITKMKRDLCAEFGVSSAVVQYRLESLKFEIDQFVRGVPLGDIRIMSRNQQELEQIHIKSLNTIEDEQDFYFDASLPEPPPLFVSNPYYAYRFDPQDDLDFLTAEEKWLYDIK